MARRARVRAELRCRLRGESEALKGPKRAEIPRSGRALKVLSRRHAQVGDIHEGHAGLQRAFDRPAEGLGGDPGIGEVAVEEAGGTSYLVEGEPATFAGELVDRLEHPEAKRYQLFQPPADLVHRQVHGLIEACDLGDLNEGRRALA